MAFHSAQLDLSPEHRRKFKLCKVRSVQFGQKVIPYLNTYDDRTIRYPDPLIKANDTIKIDLETNKIMDFIKAKQLEKEDMIKRSLYLTTQEAKTFFN
uniref:Small ribosomal subunit protein eS4 central region domain-containing protein n=1 Tax=Zea mays TaxID=4577 RepID=A0A804MKP4_MAIZE